MDLMNRRPTRERRLRTRMGAAVPGAILVGTAVVAVAAPAGAATSDSRCRPRTLLFDQAPASNAGITSGDTLAVTYESDSPLGGVAFIVGRRWVRPTLTSVPGPARYNVRISAVVPDSAGPPVEAAVGVITSGRRDRACDAKQWRGTTPAVDTRMVKTASPDPVAAGEELTYTLSATNVGNATAHNAGIVDTVPSSAPVTSVTAPAGVSCATTAVSSGTQVSCPLGDFPAGASATVTIVVVPSASGFLCNTGSVFQDDTDVQPNDNDSTVCSQVTGGPQVDTQIVKTAAPRPAVVGS